MNLAFLRYRAVRTRDGGPIESIRVAPVVLSDGSPRFEAVACLADGLRPPRRAGRTLYEDVDGAGTGLYRSQAVQIAVSEALERWAYFTVREGPQRARFGFDIEDSTNGMAAYPAWTARPARSNARLEALERWTLGRWWTGHLAARRIPSKGPDEGAISVACPGGSASLAVRWRRCEQSGRVGYGFAANNSPEDAWAKADVELTRNLRALGRAPAVTWESLDEPERSRLDRNERRLMFFASEAGNAMFRARVESSLAASAQEGLPKVLVDEEIVGPWSKFARVWRVQFEPADGADSMEERHDVFRF